MATVKVDPECPGTVRRVRRMIDNRWGGEAAMVFSEAIANVREHGDCEPAEVAIHRSGFEVRNRVHHAFQRQTSKPGGEGGYGLCIMEHMGAQCHGDAHQTRVCWRKPHPG